MTPNERKAVVNVMESLEHCLKVLCSDELKNTFFLAHKSGFAYTGDQVNIDLANRRISELRRILVDVQN